MSYLVLESFSRVHLRDSWGPGGYLEKRGMIPMPENEREFFKRMQKKYLSQNYNIFKKVGVEDTHLYDIF